MILKYELNEPKRGRFYSLKSLRSALFIFGEEIENTRAVKCLVLPVFGGKRKMARDGIEPPTQGFSVLRSTD